MDSQKLSYFLRVCETGSLSAAAERLFISQQAVSKAINSLEGELGVSLFVRTARGLVPTAYGRALQEDALAIEMRQEQAIRRIAALRGQRETGVSLSFYSGMLTQFPPRFFEDFLDAHPGTPFHFFCYPDDTHGRRFVNMDVDLFLSTTLMPDLDMTLVQETHVPLHLLTAADHPLARLPEVTLSDLRGQEIAAIVSDLEAQNRLQHAFAARGIRISSVLSDAEQALSYHLVRTGRMVAFYAGPDELLPEGTVRLPLADSPLLWSCYLYQRTSGLSPAAAALRDAIIAFRKAHSQQLQR